MAASIIDGPLFRYGNMAKILAAVFGSAVGDPNQDAGPDGVFQGEALLDPRYYFAKDQVTGYTGRVASHFMSPVLRSINQIPAALGTATIAALANVTSGTKMTLAAATTGITPNVPIVPYNAGGITAGAPVVAGLALDFGFAFGTVASGSTTVVVADAFLFRAGMPLVIAGVGNSGGTVPLLTNVLSLTDTTHIVIADKPLASKNPTAIGTGNIWGPSPSSSLTAFATPTAHLPFIAGGPALMLDPRQSIGRGVSITGVSGGAGGAFTVRGWDVYGMPMAETITAGAGVNTVYGVKAFKFIASVTPGFTDAHNYSVGTSDVFGFNYRTGVWEDSQVTWAGLSMTSSTGYTAPLSLITAATATNADVRGTIQTGAAGAGSGIGSTASNGTVSALAMTGNRLMIQNGLNASQAVLSFPSLASAASVVGTPNAAAVFGNAQFTS